MDAVLLKKVYVVVALLAVGSAMIEGLALTLTAGRQYDWRGAMASLAVAAGRRLADFIPAFLALPGAAWLYEHRVLNWDMKDPLSWVVLFLALEFAYYWFPRASHRVRWFWANHAVHHSPNQFNLSAAYRLGWFRQDHAVAGVLFAAGVAGLCATGHSGGVCDQSALSVLDSRRVDPEAFS